jgi:thioredoxin reductase
MPIPLHYDAVIVGGGPAGLSCALILGRCRRKVLICDAGKQRNRFSGHMHGYLTRDGVPPAEFLRLAREDLKPYDVRICDNTVKSLTRDGARFALEFDSGEIVTGRKVLLATGVSDKIPQIPGIDDYYGISIHHCPYCDGWEHRDQSLAVYSKGGRGFGLAISMKTWTERVVLLTDGAARFSPGEMERMQHAGVVIRRDRVTGLSGADGQLSAIQFAKGDPLAVEGMFFSSGQQQSCELAHAMGCQFSHKGAVETNRWQESCVAGVYVAGDAARDVQLVIVAAAEGAKAGFAINTALQKREEGPRLDPNIREPIAVTEGEKPNPELE